VASCLHRVRAFCLGLVGAPYCTVPKEIHLGWVEAFPLFSERNVSDVHMLVSRLHNCWCMVGVDFCFNF
jgi:hypothetical protein